VRRELKPETTFAHLQKQGMNFNQAIAAHASWKRRLAKYVAAPDFTLKASDVRANNKCELGQWIVGEGLKYSDLPEFSVLQVEHTNFHHAAAAVIQKVDSGQKLTEEDIGPHSTFGLASAAIVMAIATMKKKA
jgi:chemoreceptor zinc-binding protein